MEVKNKEELDLLFQEYKSYETKILKEIYQIIIYSKSSLSREDVFLMTQKEKEILIQILKEKMEQENKNVQ